MKHRNSLIFQMGIALFACSNSSIRVQAQVSFGVLTGPTYSNMWFIDDEDDLADYDYGHRHLLKCSFGVALDVPLTPHLSLLPEMAFRQKGFADKGKVYFGPASGGGSDEFDYRWTFDYLDVSILARLYTRGSLDGAFFALGPSVSWLLGGRVRDGATNGKYDPIQPIQYQTPPVAAIDPEWLGFRTIDLGVSLGFGYSFVLHHSWLTLEYRYQQGLLNVHNGYELHDLNGQFIAEVNSLNRCMMLNLSWMLPVGGDDVAFTPEP